MLSASDMTNGKLKSRKCEGGTVSLEVHSFKYLLNLGFKRFCADGLQDTTRQKRFARRERDQWLDPLTVLEENAWNRKAFVKCAARSYWETTRDDRRVAFVVVVV